MSDQDKILACVDHSHFARQVTDCAAWAARRLQAPLELLHVIDRHPEASSGKDHSGAIGLDAQQHLLEELSREDETQARSARERGRLLLNGLREQAVAAGVRSVDVRQRLGHLEDTLAELQTDVSLFVLGRRGESAEMTQRELGRNVESTVRSLRRPILTVTEDFKEPERLLIAFDGGTQARRGVRLLAKHVLGLGMPVHVVMSGKPPRDAQRQLDWAKNTLEEVGYAVQLSLVPGDAERAIAETIARENIDLLVMGAYSHSVWRSLIFGSKTTDLLRAVRIPVLLLR